jgi:hypothetical protein
LGLGQNLCSELGAAGGEHSVLGNPERCSEELTLFGSTDRDKDICFLVSGKLDCCQTNATSS